MATTGRESIATRVELADGLAVDAALDDGVLHAVFEWRDAGRTGTSSSSTRVPDHGSLTGAVYSLVVSPPRQWLGLALDQPASAPGEWSAAGLTDRIVAALLEEIDQRVEAVFDPDLLDDWLRADDGGPA